MSEHLLTTREVATLHGVTPGTVINWIRNEWLMAEKRGRDYMIKESDAKRYQRRPITGRPKKGCN